MFNYTNLHDVFPADSPNPYDRKLQHEIDNCRKSFDGVLFIDRVLRAVGITKAKVYPPKTDNALKQLHQQICEASMSMHYKYSLFYYVLLDFDEAAGRQGVSETFVEASGMPKKYQIFMKGLWHMDKQDFEHALEYIAHPSLIPDFADDIITILVRRARGNDYTLALSYFQTVQPILKTSAALELLFDAMARTSVSEALFYSRTHPAHTRQLLFRQLVASILEGRSSGELSTRASELAFSPLDSAEDQWFEEYLTVGNGKAHKRAKDTLLIRKIACDRVSEVANQRHGGQWSGVLEGIKGGIGGQTE
ncbi:nuclear pore complex assembly-domain-containing protein [Dactylonectria estremocensis]|uniref:Nuclear pore complex assembly-domain-containing protein n=1 Tax=Dactylonectria estremocensis TaxID=1079267 RepID=A0A9P9JBW2_9HYPO|nr:nuclear pore complex assembly-domain-containing protein [Dactylonectria estremocensis]